MLTLNVDIFAVSPGSFIVFVSSMRSSLFWLIQFSTLKWALAKKRSASHSLGTIWYIGSTNEGVKKEFSNLNAKLYFLDLNPFSLVLNGLIDKVMIDKSK